MKRRKLRRSALFLRPYRADRSACHATIALQHETADRASRPCPSPRDHAPREGKARDLWTIAHLTGLSNVRFSLFARQIKVYARRAFVPAIGVERLDGANRLANFIDKAVVMFAHAFALQNNRVRRATLATCRVVAHGVGGNFEFANSAPR